MREREQDEGSSLPSLLPMSAVGDTSAVPPRRKRWSVKRLKTAIRERLQPFVSANPFESILKNNQIAINHIARNSQLSLTNELPLPARITFCPPSYLEVPLEPLRRSPFPEEPNQNHFEEEVQTDALEENDESARTSEVDYVNPIAQNTALFFGSQESLPPFPSAVTEIVDLIRMAASLLYKEIQLVLFHETQQGFFPASRSNTWSHLGSLHRLIKSWPDENFSALDGISVFAKALNDGTILCEFVKHLTPSSIESPGYDSDPSVQSANICKFILAYESFGLAENQETLSSGNPSFADLSVEALAQYARAIISIHERFSEWPVSTLRRSNSRLLEPEPTFTSLVSASRRSSMSSRPHSYAVEDNSVHIPTLEAIHEDDGLEQPSRYTDDRRLSGPVASGSQYLVRANSMSSNLQVRKALPKPPSSDLSDNLPHELKVWYKCLETILDDEDKYQTMLNMRESDAQKLLNVFQLFLDYPRIIGSQRRKVLTALTRLSTASNLYPECLRLGSEKFIMDDNPISSGHYGEVFQGKLGDRRICVKVMRTYQRSSNEALRKVFVREAVMWGQLKHPNIIPFYGVHRLDDAYERLCLISPWMENGTLVEYLRTHLDTNRLLLVRDVLLGLDYLHGQQIVHGDLKGVNILMSNNGRARLADFGLTTLNCLETIRFPMLESSGHRGGTPRWEAPELLDDCDTAIHRTTASDVYAFGCVCYEVFTGKVPFFEVPKEYTVYCKIIKGERPTRPASGSWPSRRWGLSEAIWDLIIRCWNQVPSGRPTAKDILRFDYFRNIVDPRPKEEDAVLRSTKPSFPVPSKDIAGDTLDQL